MARGGDVQGRFPGNERARVQRNDLLLGVVLGAAWATGKGPAIVEGPPRLWPDTAARQSDCGLLRHLAARNVVVRRGPAIPAGNDGFVSASAGAFGSGQS